MLLLGMLYKNIYFVTPRVRVLLENETVIHVNHIISHLIWKMII